MTGAHRLPEFAGWSVSGRNGYLGLVVSECLVDSTEIGPDDQKARQLLVRGGTSDALYFHVPAELITTVARGRCDLRIDADVSDFLPHLRADGSVNLFLR